MGDLRATYDDHFRLIGKRIKDFPLVLIELFSLGDMVEVLQANISSKSASDVEHQSSHDVGDSVMDHRQAEIYGLAGRHITSGSLDGSVVLGEQPRHGQYEQHRGTGVGSTGTAATTQLVIIWILLSKAMSTSCRCTELLDWLATSTSQRSGREWYW